MLREYDTRHGTVLYKLDMGISTEVVMDSTTRKLSKLYDQTLFENHAEQTTSANQPTLDTFANIIDNRYYLNFNDSQHMLSNINLDFAAGSQDIVIISIVYKLNSFTCTYWTRNELFGHDNAGYDKSVTVGPSGDLVVAGTTNNNIVIVPNSVNGVSPIANAGLSSCRYVSMN